jgi:hypothetical protein
MHPHLLLRVTIDLLARIDPRISSRLRAELSNKDLRAHVPTILVTAPTDSRVDFRKMTVASARVTEVSRTTKGAVSKEAVISISRADVRADFMIKRIDSRARLRTPLRLSLS